MRLGKRAILREIRKQLDEIDEQELLATGKKYFPTKLTPGGDRHMELRFRFSLTANGVDWFVKMPLMRKFREGQSI